MTATPTQLPTQPTLPPLYGDQPAPVAAPAPVTLRAFDDVPAIRAGLFDKVHNAVVSKFPLENAKHRFELTDVKYTGSETFTKDQQKRALLRRGSLDRRLIGTWRMYDKATNTMIDEQRNTLIANVPYITERGTFIQNGNEYSVASQGRLRPGAYTRRKDNGELEAHFNVLEGGRGFRIVMDPQTSKFQMHVGNARLNLFPVLRSMGIKDEHLRERFGDELFNRNNVNDDSDRRAAKQFGALPGKLAETLATAKLDPKVMKITVGSADDHVNPNNILSAARKLVDLSAGTVDEDDRDSLNFQEILDQPSLFAERIAKDYDGFIRTNLLWKSTLKGKLNTSPGMLTAPLRSIFTKSGLAQPIEESNPYEPYEQLYRVVRTGEGGISSDRVPDASRNVQDTHFGFIDPIRSPESGASGLDNRFTINARYGSDGHVYSMFRGRDGNMVPVSADQAVESIIAFPGELKSGKPIVTAMVRGKLSSAAATDVDFEMAHPSHISGVGINSAPMTSSAMGGRAMMLAKMLGQALPLVNREAPLVRNELEDGGDFDTAYGTKAGGAIRADEAGEVLSVEPTQIRVRTADGVKTIDLYDNLPLNRRTLLRNTPAVKAGDTFEPGKLLAYSNYTDQNGALAMGTNLRTAYMSLHGITHEDAAIVSESAARTKMASEHLYSHKVDNESSVQRNKNAFMSLYPKTFKIEQLKNLDEDGVVTPGTIIKHGDPLILAVKERQISELHRGRKPGWMDASETWENDVDGEVIDVEKTSKGSRITIRTVEPMRVGDKGSPRYGDKFVVGDIWPDDKMPKDSQGRPMELVLNPLTTVTRSNPSQLYEALLGKLAEKLGKPVLMPQFTEGHTAEIVSKMLAEHGVPETEDLTDPDTGRVYKGISVGPRFVMKLHHMAAHDIDARDTGVYTAEGMPAKGGEGAAKRLGLADVNALISHGATAVLRDAKAVRGQRNDDYWKAFMLGHTPPAPNVSHVYRKFLASMPASGINIRKKSDGALQLTAMTDSMVDEISSGEIVRGAGVDRSTMTELPGGLFDKTVTGGLGGNNWSTIKLDEPIPNPAFEEPIRRMLGNISRKKLEDILAGRERLNGMTGGDALVNALKMMDPERIEQDAKHVIKTGSASKRDNAVKLLRYARMFKDTGVRPHELMISKVPVIPPAMRPVISTENFIARADANALYVDVIKANEAMRKITEAFGKDAAGEERVNLYKAFGAVTGLTDTTNVQLKNQGVRGILQQVFGSSPKCYDDQTDVLTEWGWVPFKDYKRGQVATVNPLNGAFEWGTPSAVVHQRYFGPMIRTSGDYVDALVTPNHEHWVSNHKVEASTLARQAAEFKTAAKTTVGAVDTPVAYLQLLAEWTNYGTMVDEHPVMPIHEHGHRPVPSVPELLKALGLKHTITDNGWVRTARMLDARMSEQLASTGYQLHMRRLPADLLHMDGKLIRIFLEYLCRDQAIARSQALVDDIQNLAVRCGVVLDVHKRPGYWTVELVHVPQVLGLSYTVEKYDGHVHCVTVPNGLIIVRRNGKTLVSGNSGFFQRRVIGGTVDEVGRAVVTPNPDLDMDQVGLPEDAAWVLYRPHIVRSLAKRGIPADSAMKHVEERSELAKKELDIVMSHVPVLVKRDPVLHKYNIMGFMPVLSKGKSLQVNPTVLPGFNMDFDGDHANFHVPIDPDAVEEVKQKMLPSKNLLHAESFKAHLTPTNEFLHGLYIASTRKESRDPVVFDTMVDMLRAYKRGLIDVGTNVVVREKRV